MKMLAGMVAALALVGVTGAYAQGVYPGEPYAYPGAPYAYPGGPYPYSGAPYPAPPVAAPAPYGGAYIQGPYPGSVVVNPYTGRWCTFEPSGWHWCWTP
jgi:hypothetical protein